MKKIYLISMVTLIFSIFTGCHKKNIKFSKDVFLKYTTTPAGECASYESYDTNVEVSSDGTVKIYCDNFNESYEDEYPTNTIQLSEEDIADIKDTIKKNNILSLPKDISVDSCDGDYYSLTIYTKEDEHTSSGLNVDNKRFLAVKELLYDFVWEDIEELQSEINSIQEAGYNNTYGAN